LAALCKRGIITMDVEARQQIETAVQAVDDALTGLVGFLMTLRPTLRNEILQICGRHMDKAREARERLRAMLETSPGPDAA
jgi:hypothetical protein